jgi:hypothetical protein
VITRWSMLKRARRYDEAEGVVFLDLAVDPPEFYITTGDWVRDDVAKHYADYLATHGGTRRDNPGSRHHKVTTQRVAQWRDRWDLLATEYSPGERVAPPAGHCTDMLFAGDGSKQGLQCPHCPWVGAGTQCALATAWLHRHKSPVCHR